MSDEVKDAGLVAMISSILGGNKRADPVAPPPLAEVPPIVPADPVEPAATSRSESKPEFRSDAAEAESAPDAAAAAAEPAEPPAQIATTRDGKRLLPAEAIADLVLGELRKLDNFPSSGVSVTVYGYRHWNAMLTFAPFSTSFQNATRFRQAVPDLVFKLRRFVELEI
ncbi:MULTISPECIES: hypothetical protein [unclassified Bradyrhizobium]|uniref:hypothetical protein n=1 Tax=unclassified Bradyrhizobium TaxID=2631580 RepID=UPI000D65E128|nr:MULTISPECIES: hypothetical protein [unclassified Bradyrhizobium]MCA1476252.1 hypothetical protein [Bradyrhizobium sp. NBAIM08]MCA1500380.1 hypothetical protein [Bradyrhizobium sp. NBAIM14]MCA1535178.1 hypothetical protein [Bradyrhizobium sp. NBAIM03]PWE80991.1 hypothetical protein XF30_33430 [Bradyrhizobium sp. SUTN9-2]